MICPSCAHPNEDKVRFCARCRMAFSKTSLFFSRLHEDLYWILRRAMAGFTTGWVAWIFIPMINRILSQFSSELVTMPLTGLLGGAFLGCVDGMVEESSPKTLWGAFLGGAGGFLGGLVFVGLYQKVPPEQILWVLFLYWAIAGAAIGLVSALWERHRRKILAGILSGFIGGGIGGYLGAGMHANLLEQLKPQAWVAQRLLESLIGAFIGVTLWFSIGLAERFIIFQRRLVKDSDFKECDQCRHKNPLKSWYCGICGSVLQVSVPVAKLNMPPSLTLFRLSEMFHFLSRLSAATGFIAGFAALFILIPGNPFLVIVVLVLIALVSFAFQVVCSSFSELLQILAKK